MASTPQGNSTPDSAGDDENWHNLFLLPQSPDDGVSKTVPREALAIICMPTGGRVLLKALRALTHLKQYYEIKTTYSLPFMDREPEAYGRKVMHPKALGW